jgi:DNA-binding MarR family transcriptional regulator
VTTRDRHFTSVLSAIESGEVCSQRALARHVGIALGLANLIIKELEGRGWVYVIRVGSNRARYRLTPAGLTAHEELLRAKLVEDLEGYGTARRRVQLRLTALSRDWPPEHAACCGGTKPVVFYGASPLAEIAYACLQRTDLTLAGVVDDKKDDREFFGRRVDPLRALAAQGAGPYGRIVVTSLGDDAEEIRRKIAAIGLSPDRLFWL